MDPGIAGEVMTWWLVRWTLYKLPQGVATGTNADAFNKSGNLQFQNSVQTATLTAVSMALPFVTGELNS